MALTQQAFGAAGVAGGLLGTGMNVPEGFQAGGLGSVAPGAPQAFGGGGEAGVDFREFGDQLLRALTGAAAAADVKCQWGEVYAKLFEAGIERTAALGDPRLLRRTAV